MTFLARKLGERERESAWRITRKHLRELRKGNGLDGRVLHRSILEK